MTRGIINRLTHVFSPLLDDIYLSVKSAYKYELRLLLFVVVNYSNFLVEIFKTNILDLGS